MSDLNLLRDSKKDVKFPSWHEFLDDGDSLLLQNSLTLCTSCFGNVRRGAILKQKDKLNIGTACQWNSTLTRKGVNKQTGVTIAGAYII